MSYKLPFITADQVKDQDALLKALNRWAAELRRVPIIERPESINNENGDTLVYDSKTGKFENCSEMLDWEPNYPAFGSLTFTNVTTHIAVYEVRRVRFRDTFYNRVDYTISAQGTLGGTANIALLFTPPPEYIPVYLTNGSSTLLYAGHGYVVGSSGATGRCFYQTSISAFRVQRYDNANFPNTGTGYFGMTGWYLSEI